MSEGYQGWANWDTWAVSLNLMNDEGAYEETRRWFERADGDRRELARIASEECWEWLVDEVDADAVDWQELASAIIEVWATA